MSQAGSFLNGVFPPGTVVQTLTGNAGGAVGPDGAQNINVVGTGDITVTGNPGTNTLTISSSGAVADSFPTDAGTATPLLGVLNVLGGANIGTTGAANNVTINLDGTTNHSVQVGTGATGLTSLAIGTNGQVLIGATAADPAFATLTSADSSITFTTGANSLGLTVTGGATVGKTITGNSGGALTPTAGNWNIITANSTAKFVGAGSTLTLDFSLTNLILGNNGSTITIGTANDGFGLGVLQNITSGTSNSAFGNASLQNITIGSQNSAYGASSGTALNTGGNNTLVGFQSGLLLQSGNSSVALGYQSGSAWGAAVSNNIAIGSIGAVADSARIRIGTNGTHTSAFFAGIDGVNVGSVAKVVTMASDQLGTATITAGSNITVTPGANTITIAATAAGTTWSVITANQTAAVSNGYFCNKAGTLAVALPAASAIGDVIEVSNENTALGVQFTQAAGQQILIGNTNTTLGATGTLTSSAVGDTLKIVCKVANTIWRATSIVGNWTPV